MDYPEHFLSVTENRYRSMRKRFGNLPFSLSEFRNFLIELLGGAEGITYCEYCNRLLMLESAHVGAGGEVIGRLELDHRIPVKEQGGSLGFENLAPCCPECNQQKGSLSYLAFLHLRALVYDPQKFTDVDRCDLLGRLQSQLKLALREQARLKATRQTIRLNPIRRQRLA